MRDTIAQDKPHNLLARTNHVEIFINYLFPWRIINTLHIPEAYVSLCWSCFSVIMIKHWYFRVRKPRNIKSLVDWKIHGWTRQYQGKRQSIIDHNDTSLLDHDLQWLNSNIMTGQGEAQTHTHTNTQAHALRQTHSYTPAHTRTPNIYAYMYSCTWIYKQTHAHLL